MQGDISKSTAPEADGALISGRVSLGAARGVRQALAGAIFVAYLVLGVECGYAETPMEVVAMTLSNHVDGRAARSARRVCGGEWYHEQS